MALESIVFDTCTALVEVETHGINILDSWTCIVVSYQVCTSYVSGGKSEQGLAVRNGEHILYSCCGP